MMAISKSGMAGHKMKLLFALISFSAVTYAKGQSLSWSIAPKPWLAGLGNHRALLRVNKPANAIRLQITWRLHGQEPGKKRLLIINGNNGDTIQNVYQVAVSNERCDIVFGPVATPGVYYLYYLPFKPDLDAGYYQYGYLPSKLPDIQWVKRNRLGDTAALSKLPRARCSELQARTAFDSFYPMEIIPVKSEKEDFLSRHDDDYLLFPESRRFPIRMQDEIPLKWIKEGPGKEFTGVAERDEYYTFQIGLYAVKSSISDAKVAFSDLKGPNHHAIPAAALTCFNTEGINSYGKPFVKQLDVPEGRVQALWIGIDIPGNAEPGIYNGEVTISAFQQKPQKIPVQIRITGKYLTDRGDSEPWRYSRLRWLNSTAGISDKPTVPFTPIKSDGENQFSFSGKQVMLASDALPASIKVQGTNVLAAPIRCVAVGEDLNSSKFVANSENEGNVAGSWTSQSKDFTLEGKWSLQFDGYLHYKIDLKALKDAVLKDFRLEIPFRKEVAQYMMGMGRPGSVVPDSIDAKWKGPHDSFWIGNTYGGLYCELLGSTYHGPLLNLYKPAPPASWYNDNKGGFSIRKDSNAVIATVYSGSRDFKKGEGISYEFDFIITPIKKLDTKAQFTERYYHNGSNAWPDSSVVASGIKVINIHQGNIDNPYINYPFLAHKRIKRFADYWHRKGIKTKIYYTIRELTDRTPELWALRSLGHEIFSGGKGGGYPWLREHLISDYTPAWYTPIGDNIGDIDAAIETAPGDSRWYNFYIRGLAWLIKNEDIDGLYMDDVAFDRHIIKRMREVMDSIKPGCRIDLHSNTGFSIGPATQYTAFFPYINKLWFGESFQYNKMPPANWLVESSGIPFGLMGDMLYKGGNPWRGMVYGMSSRLGWETEGVHCDPRPVWKIWDSFGIADAKMIGYWDKNPVVSTSDPDVLATVYVKKEKTLIAIASWAPALVKVKLAIDWKALGLNPEKVKLTVPAITQFQPAAAFLPDEEIPVEPGKGWLLIAQEN